jgi:hypothetical protein
MNNKKRPIDPICAMCRIISLNFKDVKTKLSITDHTLNLQQPTVSQGLLRLYHGDTREDVFELFFVIVRLIIWFVAPRSNGIAKKLPDENLTGEIKKMAQYMCTGLEKLQSTYGGGTVVIALQYYINILKDGLNGSFSTNKLPTCILEDLEIDTNIKVNLISMWDFNRLHVICDLFDNCFAESVKQHSKRNDIIEGYLLSIDSILSVYEREFKQKIKEWG